MQKEEEDGTEKKSGIDSNEGENKKEGKNIHTVFSSITTCEETKNEATFGRKTRKSPTNIYYHNIFLHRRKGWWLSVKSGNAANFSKQRCLSPFKSQR